MRRKLRFWIAECGFGLAAACDEAQVGALEQIREEKAFGRTVSLHKDAAVFECELVGLAFLEGRSWRCRCDGQERCDCVVSSCKDGWDHRRGGHRTAGERAFGKGSIAENGFDLVERDAGPLRGQLREDRVSAGADVLRAAGDT